MIGKPNTNITQMSDVAIVVQVGRFIKHTRIQQKKTQMDLAESSGLNRWTLGQIESGQSVSLSSLIQILRALDSLHVFNVFEISTELSPIEYAKLKKKKQKIRVRNKKSINNQEDVEW